MKAAIYTLGCKVNQSESAAMEELLRQAGYEMVRPGEEADVYIVNSCTVTAEGAAKSRRWLRGAKRRNPAAVTVMTGCFPQASPEEALAFEADVLTGTAARARLPALLARFMETGQKVVDIAPQTAAFEELPATRQPGRTRAFLKVQDGCNRRCAYCIIPAARGPSRSRKEADILAEAAAQAQAGVRELVLTGINLPSYGRDNGTSLARLCEKLSDVEGLWRIRLSSLDPDLLAREDISRFAALPKLCPQFHLSLQSGCAATLRRMRRPYTPEDYRAAALALRAAIPGAVLTTDVIVGFPGESEEEFAQSLAFVKEMKFLKVHVFPFSKRPGTPAAEMPGQIPGAEKEKRAAEMQRLADEVRAGLLAQMEGETDEVLLETPLPSGLFTGYTRRYVPVMVAAPGHAQGQVVRVRLGSFNGERAEAQMLPP